MKNTLKKHQRLILIFGLLFFGLIKSSSQTNNFKIVFVANTIFLCNNDDWIDKVKSNWGTTGICINVNWGDFSDSINHINFTNIDTAINRVSRRKDLDIYIRISMGAFKPEWVKPGSAGLTSEDFQITKTRELYNHFNYNKDSDPIRTRHPLNLGSQLSRSYMLNFYAEVLKHLDTLHDTTKIKIKEIVPTISADAEMEYPNAEMCGYSTPENAKFISYLISKYQFIENLNKNWKTNFNSFDPVTINPSNYNWDVDISSSDAANKNCLPGRLDWINFKTSLLKSFIDECVFIKDTIHSDFKIGLQIGSIYDDVILRRGWFDITSLIENVDVVHVADIANYRNNFKFGADYLRSVCKYWGNLKSKEIEFSTETNWPGFNNMSSSKLTDDWTQQLYSYYDSGSTAHYIFGWDINYNDLLISTYSNWRTQLNIKRNIKNIENLKAVHLSCEFSNYYYTLPTYYQNICSDTVRLLNTICRLYPYSNNYNCYDENCDIITNYMVKNTPYYLNKYDNIYLTKSSVYIPDIAYKNFMKRDLTFNLGNATWYSDNGHYEYAYTQGLRNEYDQYRSPIHLIWRSRTDLMNTFTFPQNATRFQNIISLNNLFTWAQNHGTGLSNINNREYPDWNIMLNYIEDNPIYEIPISNFDINARKAWELRTDLRAVFQNGFYSTDNSWNLIDWTMQYGFNENPDLLEGYQNWPYIGTNSTQPLNAKSQIIYDSLKHTIQNLEESKNTFSIYPNTVKQGQSIFVKSNLSNDLSFSIKLFSVSGKLTNEYVCKNEVIQINTSKLDKGIYILVLRDKRFKILVQ